MVDVSEDLNRSWKEQTALQSGKNSMYNTFTTNEGLWGPPDSKSQYKYSQIQRRSNSHMGDEPANRTLKLAGKETLSFPKRQRFNEDTE